MWSVFATGLVAESQRYDRMAEREDADFQKLSSSLSFVFSVWKVERSGVEFGQSSGKLSPLQTFLNTLSKCSRKMGSLACPAVL